MLNFPKWKIYLVLIVFLWSIYAALPNLISQEAALNLGYKEDSRISLGLDLQGGSQLLLEVDFASFFDEHMDSLVKDIKRTLWDKRIRYRSVSYLKNNQQNNDDDNSVISQDNYAIHVALQDKDSESTNIDEQIEKVTSTIRDISSDFEVTVNAEKIIIITYRENAFRNILKNTVAQSIEIARKRVDELGTKEPIIQRQGDNRILLQVPGLQNPEQLKELLGKTAKMTFHLMDETDPYAYATEKPRPGYMMLQEYQADNNNNQKDDAGALRQYIVKRNAELSGEYLVDAQATFDRGMPVVSFRFNNQGGKKFATITSDNVGKPFAIVLDGKVITAPRINQAILSGSGIITGNFSTKSANELAILLRSGALPAPIKILEERTIGPSLGQDSVESGKIATVLAVSLVLISMLLIYKRFGFYSNLALGLNLLLIIAILSFFGATLTLPGIAGIVLTMGMAVDANVLIFERIKEELRLGKTPFAAVDNGFSSAFKTIIDSNITTLIATFLLFTYGTGPVKGFAVTLSVGIISSMFSAIMFTRMLIVLWLKKKKPSTLKI